jgi:hypothetical protein
MIAGCQVKHWRKTQSTIALSSGEAELSGIGSGMAQALGVQSLCADMGWQLKPRLHSDATAAIGIAKRRGLGKIRHLHCTDLWVQEKVRNGDIELLKILGIDNPADAFTKYLDRACMEKAIAAMKLEFMEGRDKSALATMGLEKAPTAPVASTNK